MGTLRGAIWLTAILAAIGVAAPHTARAAAIAQAAFGSDVPLTFDIPPQALDTALLAFARQSGVQVISAAEPVLNKESRGFRGTATPRRVLRRLLRDFDLDYQWTDVGTVTILSARGAAAAANAGASARLGPPPLQNSDDPPVIGDVGDMLEEVLVTATRQLDTVNRVPLSVSALTQRVIDQQGIRSVADMTGTVPAFSVMQTAPGVAFVAIRGIQNNNAGAATTGFYLDDTPLTKRGALGCCTGNGSPLPSLFDIERVEVLRGPQGTLFGSGSQGGTVRYITNAPSLTRYSAYGRMEASSTAGGDPSYEAGLAVGGPIIQDRLGFRVSYFDRHTGGWLDYVNRATGAKEAHRANWGDTRVFRAALAVAPTDTLRMTAAYFASRDAWNSRTQAYTLSTDRPVTEPEACYDTRGLLLPSCASPLVNYRRGPQTLPALPNLGDHSTVDTRLSPAKTNLTVGTLTLDKDFGQLSLRSITSYNNDQNFMSQGGGGTQNRIRGTRQTYGDITFAAQTFYGGLARLPQDITWGINQIDNRRSGLTQEMRLSSPGEGKSRSWVAGVYYSNQRNTQRYDLYYPDFDLLVRSLIGVGAQQRYGLPMYSFQGQPVGWSAKYQTMKDTELAAFGEMNLWLTDRFKATAGVRLARLSFDYFEVHYGPASGGNDAAAVPGGLTGPLRHTGSTIAPKFGVQYQLSADDMLYGVVAKGFRAGGVNASIPTLLCAATLARFGETVTSVPQSYQSDTVWSFEGGAKVRVMQNRLQVNSAVYRIDWENIQTNVSIPTPCVGNFIGNGGRARSQGIEIEAQARLFSSISANLAFAYNHAEYVGTTLGLGKPGFETIPVAYDGQRIPVAPWTIQLGLRYERELREGLRVYGRGDFRYIRHYENTAAQVFGNTVYSPTGRYPDTARTNLRVGVEYAALDINLFATNFFNSRKGEVTGGYNTCPASGGAACTTGLYTPYYVVTPASPPRQIGVQMAYRY